MVSVAIKFSLWIRNIMIDSVFLPRKMKQKHRSQNIDEDISRIEGEEEYRKVNVLDLLKRGIPENGENFQVIRKMED